MDIFASLVLEHLDLGVLHDECVGGAYAAVSTVVYRRASVRNCVLRVGGG